jgi:hypothetical protein
MKSNCEIREQLDNGCRLMALLGDFGDERRWIAITSFKIDPETGMSTRKGEGIPWKYRVRCFGLPVSYDYLNYDVHEENLTNYVNTVFDDIDAALAEVATWLGDVALLKDQLPDGCPI